MLWYKLTIIVVAFLVAQCVGPPSVEKPPDRSWKKVIIPRESAVTSFYGDIYASMIVGTNRNILKTTDSGRTWQTVATNVDQVKKFTRQKDTLFAISLGADQFSLDEGDTWHKLSYERIPDISTDHRVKTSSGQVFKLENYSSGELGYPGKVLMSADGRDKWKEVFPFKHSIFSLYVDASDKVYVGAWGAGWNEHSGFIAKTTEDALIYYLVN